MGRVLGFLGVLPLFSALSIGLFAFVSYKDSLKPVDMAILIGRGEYTAFLSVEQKKQLDEVISRYNQGYFSVLYLTAPYSLRVRGNIPFAAVDYLKKKGLSAQQLVVDDTSHSFSELTQKVYVMMRDTDEPEVLVFADALEMARVKIAFANAKSMSVGFGHTSKLTVDQFIPVFDEVILIARNFFISTAFADIPEEPQLELIRNKEARLLSSSLQQMMSKNVRVQWGFSR